MKEKQAIQELLKLVKWMALWINNVGGRNYGNGQRHVEEHISAIEIYLERKQPDTSMHQMD